jgi:hypothetical protein
MVYGDAPPTGDCVEMLQYLCSKISTYQMVGVKYH